VTGPDAVTDLDGVRRGYEALRLGVGARRLGVDVVTVTGPDATAFLQGQLSQDLDPLGEGDAAPALVLEPDGKLRALVRATKLSDDAWALDTDAGFGEGVASRLARFKLRTKVEIRAADWPCVALRGREVAAALAGSRAAGRPGERDGAVHVLPVAWNGTEGADLLGPGALTAVPEDAAWCDPAAWEALRVEAGIPKMGAELDDRTIAAEAGLVGRTVSFTKGCYTGQELVARLDARGNRVARRLCGVVAPGLGAATAASLLGAELWRPGPGGGLDRGPDGEKAVGRCTSAAWCPGLDAVAALGYLHRSVEVPADLVWFPSGGGADRGAPAGRPALARALPLVAP